MQRILLIDDDVDILQSMQNFLTREGFAVDIAEDGKDGLELIHREQFDLVITDIVMSEKDGYAVIKEIKEKNPSTKIIAMSGGGVISAKDHLDTAKQVQADLTLSKPFSMEKLMEQIKELL